MSSQKNTKRQSIRNIDDEELEIEPILNTLDPFDDFSQVEKTNNSKKQDLLKKSELSNSSNQSLEQNLALENYSEVDILDNLNKDTPFSFRSQNDEIIFALPSELDDINAPYQQHLAEDGFYKKSAPKIIKRGSKLSTGNKENLKDIPDKINSREYRFIGRKGIKTWSKKVSTLRSHFGFSWQKNARKILISTSLLGIFLVISLSSVAAMAIDMWNNTESIDRLERKPAENSVVYARDGKTKLFEFFEEERREVIPGDDIPLIMKSATLALEDERFYENQAKESWQKGIPWTNLAGATFKCLVSGGNECRGASGISQQLIKNMTGDDSQDIDRKVRELFRAIKLNQEKTPDEILSTYLNWVPFGRNAYGVQEASRAYFGRPANMRDEKGNHVMTPVEACYLSAIINRPGYYQSAIPSLEAANKRVIESRRLSSDPNKAAQPINTENQEEDQNLPTIPQSAIDLENRKNICLTKLKEVELKVYERDKEGKIVTNSEGQPILTNGFVIESQEELERLIETPVIITSDSGVAENFRKERGGVAFVNTKIDDPFPHFREYFTKEIERVIDRDSLNTNGYDIVTTLDIKMQKEVDKIVKDYEPLVVASGGNNAAAIVLDGPTGEILSMVGSFDYNRDDIDGKVNVTTAPRQPGSSIKPFVYMAAFANGFNPGNILIDTQTSWGGYTPKNFSGTFNGPVSMRRALQGSLNIPALKALFLVDNAPVWNERSKLDTFFNFSTDLGLRFPCIEGGTNAAFPGGVERCSVDEEKGITQEMIDNAARSRCGISTALGGCEVTMVSHATAYNTILQEGNLRTATPFISIKDNDKGEDIYKKRQKSDNQPFPTRTLNIEKKEDAEKILLARQMANLLTDSQSRKPEFGPLWVNLNVRNYGNGLSDGLAAAKTGTTNGPKDFWTCGGSVYYTVCVWAGRTDNKNMLSSASSGRVAALLWQSIMENIHADKTPVKFSTQGLIPAYVGGSKGKENPETGEIEGATQGRLELLTPKQNSEKFIKNGVVSFQTKEQVEEFKKKDIFDNRTALLTASYYINSLDGGLFVEGKTPEQLKKEVTCQLLVGEFPQSPNWNEPIVRLAKSSDKYCTLPDPSTQNEVDNSPPVFNTNFTTGVINNINQVNISANFATESGKKVKKMELFINSSLVSVTENQNSVSAPIQPSNSAYKITVKVTDTLNKTYVKEYIDIKVGSPLTASDVSNISCSSSGLCTFNILDPSKPFNQIQLSHQSVIYTCSINAMLVTCNLNGVNLSGVTTLGVLIDGNSYVKNVTVIP